MANSHSDLYNGLLNATACINIPVKLFTLYIILTRTPKHLRHDSYFILDVMFWNFSANLLLAITHPLPLQSGRCYRLKGLLGDNETVGCATSLAISVCMLHWAVGLVLAFFYRYFAFVHPRLAARITPRCAFWLCALAHLIATASAAALLILTNASYDEYPSEAELPDRHLLFCFARYGWKRTFLLGHLLVVAVLGVAIIVTLSGLLLRKISYSADIFHPETLRIQRRLLWNLIILTGIVLLFGTAPLVFSLLVVSLPSFPQANAICSMNIVITANHGTLYALATLVLFKPYRKTVCGMLRRVVGQFPSNSGKVRVFVKVDPVRLAKGLANKA